MTTSHPTSGVMIDSPETNDRDDAIWVHRDANGYTAWVHIAHVAAHTRPGDDIDQRARHRVHTRYRADYTRSMLPNSIEHHASLQPGTNQQTLRVTMRFDNDGTPTDYGIHTGHLDQAYVVAYPDVAHTITDTKHPAHSALADAHSLATALLARRRQSGALALYDLVKGYATNEEGQIIALAAHERNPGYLIVAELMIATNVTLATWAAEYDIPILFRNHRIATVAGERRELIDQLSAAQALSDPDHYRNLRARIRIVQRAATYDPAVYGHFGLNLTAYAHCTSPLRRYADLVNQRIIIAAIEDHNTPHSLPELNSIATHINDTIQAERAARAAHFKHVAHKRLDARLDHTRITELDSTEFHRALRVATTSAPTPALTAEISRRLNDDTLPTRDWYEILFNTTHTAWEQARDIVSTALSARPHIALTVLNIHAQALAGGPVGPDTVTWTVNSVGSPHQPLFEATLTIAVNGDTTTSPTRTHRSKKDAKNNAALALIAQLVGIQDTSLDVGATDTPIQRSATLELVPPERNDAMALNEYAQNGIITPVTWAYNTEGPPHQPTFTCVGTTTTSHGDVSATGTGGSKTVARADTATRLRTTIESYLRHDVTA